MKHLRSRLTYANVMATIAVFIALGGASYAATQLPKNSVGAKQLKDGAVTPAKLSKATAAALAGKQGPKGDQGPNGAQGPKGDPGASAIAIWAEVNSSGEIKKKSPAVVAAKKESMGLYRVEFSRDISACAYLATMGFTHGEVEVDSVKPDAVRVETFTSAGSLQDQRFHLAVLC